MSHVITDNTALHRYEIHVDGELAGVEEYTFDHPGTISFNHTEVYAAFAGTGLARELVAHVLADARRRGLAVLPYCPYVASIIRKDPASWLDLVPADQRTRFNLPA